MSDIENSIEKIVESFDARVYEIEKTKEFDQDIYRVMITKEGGVTLDNCADISSELSLFLDVNPPMEGEYRLEVSSPGVERKLVKQKHFIQSVGEKVKLKIVDAGQIIGLLSGADEDGIRVVVDGKEESFSYDKINKARTYFEW